MFKIEIEKGLENLPLAEGVREEVFVKEQGYSKDIEVDEHDTEAYHILISKEGQPIATARAFLESAGVYHIGRVCVKKEFRKLGLGKTLIEELETHCKARGGKKFTLGAQLHAEKFYENLGYHREGEIFLDEGEPHVEMVKSTK